MRLSVIARIFSAMGEYVRLGTLDITFENLNPEYFEEYEESLMFSEWFCYIWMKKRTLEQVRKEIEEAGGNVSFRFERNLPDFDYRAVSGEARYMEEIIRIG